MPALTFIKEKNNFFKSLEPTPPLKSLFDLNMSLLLLENFSLKTDCTALTFH